MQKRRQSTLEDEKIVDLIRADEESMIRGMEYLYTRNDLQRIAYRVYHRYAANLNDIHWQDLFCESIVRLVRSILLERYQESRRLPAFFAKICANYCSELVRKKGKKGGESYDDIINPEVEIASEELKSILQEVMDQQGAQCKRIFELLFFQSEPWQMEDIAKEVGLGGSRSAITTYYRCRKKLVQFIEKQPHLADLIKSYL